MSITRGGALSAADQRFILALARWRALLEDRALRMECPDAYHDILLREADELERRGVIGWEEWRDLRLEADAAYLQAVAGADFHGQRGR